ncbi:MAG TPA: S1/P1 nuclease [Ferruginibacter sp.]|nr:S1/P1 nuclease [Ferruginibacter sp.]
MHSYFKRILVLSLCFYIPLQSGAWSLLGHRIVGQIADHYLTPAAKVQVGKILGNESIAMASNWPDFIKSDTNYNYLSTWHYINIKGGMQYADVKSFLIADTATDAYTKINFLVKELKKRNLPPKDKILYLRLLIHIVGDIHQPLHVGRPEDRGGNSIKVLWFNVPYNLHQVWDQQLVNSQQLSYTEYTKAIDFTTKAQRAALQKEPMYDWFWQSYQVAEKIYADVKMPDEKLGYNYEFKYIETLNQQLLKGGVHLAGLLNTIFK